jgi:hypothetical protein
MAETRKLAAILAADVVGYSKLASGDEERTLARLRALRSDLIDPTISVHNGRVGKRTGDGVLIEFRSFGDAVRCAIEVQNGMVERNAALPPERRIEFRFAFILATWSKRVTALEPLQLGVFSTAIKSLSDGPSTPLTASKLDHGWSRLPIARPTEQWTRLAQPPAQCLPALRSRFHSALPKLPRHCLLLEASTPQW